MFNRPTDNSYGVCKLKLATFSMLDKIIQKVTFIIPVSGQSHIITDNFAKAMIPALIIVVSNS